MDARALLALVREHRANPHQLAQEVAEAQREHDADRLDDAGMIEAADLLREPEGSPPEPEPPPEGE